MTDVGRSHHKSLMGLRPCTASISNSGCRGSLSFGAENHGRRAKPQLFKLLFSYKNYPGFKVETRWLSYGRSTEMVGSVFSHLRVPPAVFDLLQMQVISGKDTDEMNADGP
jgi:hypothetical protein